MSEISRFIVALLRRNDFLTALPRLILGLVWGFLLLCFPFAAVRIGSWLLVILTALWAVWFYGAHKRTKKFWNAYLSVAIIPLLALLYTCVGRPDVACGYAVAVWALCVCWGEWRWAEKSAKAQRAMGVLSGLAALVFAWKALSVDFADLAPVYALYLFALTGFYATNLKIAPRMRKD